MANNEMIIDERQRELGNFLVGRLLPFRKKRNVGPFVFIDHMGPLSLEQGQYFDVDQHPHIGLCTLTYLFEGQIEHRDSTGSVQIIIPGDAGFMTAGKAVTHTERTPAHLRNGDALLMHGYQIWLALPRHLEDSEPRFDYYKREDIPEWRDGNALIRLVAGSGFGRQSPLKGYSHMFMVDIEALDDEVLDLGNKLEGEIAFVLVRGSLDIGGEKIKAGQMLISKTREQCKIELEAGTQLLIFGGESFPEERFLMWNFVSSDKEKLKEARTRWQERKFPVVPGDETYIPIPV